MRTPIISAALLLSACATTANAETVLITNLGSIVVYDVPDFSTTLVGTSIRLKENCGFSFLSPISLALRPSDGMMYMYSTINAPALTTLYKFSVYTPVAKTVAQVGAPFANAGPMIFKPDGSELRVLRTNAQQTAVQNLRVNPDTGAIIATETDLSYSNVSGAIPRLSGLGFTNDNPPRLLGFDFVRRSIVEVGSAAGGEASWNAGVCTELVTVQFPPELSLSIGGFDVSPQTGIAYIQYSQNNVGTTHVRWFSSVDLTTGALTVLGQPGSPGPHAGATKVLGPSTAGPIICTGDANGDFYVNACDLSAMLGAFGNTVPTPGQFADYNADGIINAADLSVLLANFGSEC